MLDLDMGRYALFVWPAWGVSALVVIALIARAFIASRKWKRELARLDTTTGEAARSANGREK